MPETPKKTTIYIDADEEITSVVDKVRSAPGDVVAMVLPKRAGVLHSSVNMKLLKRSADQNNKQLVLITTESTLLPLAGMAGLYVASSLKSKPSIPAREVEEPMVPEEPVQIDDSTTVADVAPETAASDQGPIQIDNSPKDTATTGSKKKSASSKKAGKKQAKVPNFNKFRMLLFGGIAALILLLIFGWWAFFVAPSAVVTIKGDTTKATASFDMIADTQATELNEETGLIPAKNQELKKSDVEKVPATGQKDKGTKATGTVTLSTSCSAIVPSIPAGTGVSTNNLTYVTSSSVSLTTPSIDSQGKCTFSGKVDVSAQNPGDQYNVSAGRSFAVSGYSGVSGTNSAAFSGGTSQIVKVVSASDVENAKQKLSAKQVNAQDELKQGLKDGGYVSIPDSFTAGTPKVTVSPAVDSEASEVTVTSETTYSMLGVKEVDLKTLIKKSVSDEIDVDKQGILSYGLTDASFKIGAKKGTKTTIGVQTEVVAGPKIDEVTIKKEVAGKKRGEAEQALSSMSGVKEVKIETKPFWNASVPKKEAKIKVTIQKEDGSSFEP